MVAGFGCGRSQESRKQSLNSGYRAIKGDISPIILRNQILPTAQATKGRYCPLEPLERNTVLPTFDFSPASGAVRAGETARLVK